MHRPTPALFISLLAIMLCLPLYATQANDLEEVQRLEERLSALEQEATALRSDIEILKAQTAITPAYDSVQNTSTLLLGTWACTNNVFNYELSLMQNGVVITKEMSSGKTMQGKWLRRGTDDIVIGHTGYYSSGQAKSFTVKDISEDRMSLEEPNTQSIYECDKLSQE